MKKMFKWLKNALNPEEDIKKDDKFEDVIENEAPLIEDSELIEEEIEVVEDDSYSGNINEDENFIEIVEEVSVDEINEEEVIDNLTEEVVIVDESDDEVIEEDNNDGLFGFFKKVFTGLEKTRNNFTDKINGVLGTYLTIDEEL